MREDLVERNRAMIAYKAEGHTNKEVAEAFRVCVGVVQKICKGISGKTARNAAMRAYKAEGHSMKEVAEHFGVTQQVAQCVCQGIAPQTERRPKHLANKYTADTEKARQAKRDQILKTLETNAPGFEYAGGYTDGKGTVQIRCKTCGNVETRLWLTLRHKAVKGTKAVCPVCAEAERIRRKAESEAQKKAEAQKRSEAAQWKRYERSIKQWTFAPCKECGSLFVMKNSHDRYCSDECRRKAQNNRKDRRLRGVTQDYGITLPKLFNRDGGRCYLCGGMCDWGDIDGNIAGNNYPSIDHVILIAKGGTHTWDNVRLAHRICNTRKSDTLPLPRKAAI